MRMEKYLKFILEETAANRIDRKTALQMISWLRNDEMHTNEDIAIVGMAVKLPEANTYKEFWNNILSCGDYINTFPENRKKDMAPYFEAKDIDVNKIQYMEGAYIDEINQFDYEFFRISPKEASLMDPNHRLFLEVAWQAIEDAGMGGDKLVGSKTGVYVGYASNEKDQYGNFIYDTNPTMVDLSVVGNMSSVLASRIAYILDLKGPSVMIDTACSSSLVAVHQACVGIKNGDCDIAIVGGVKIHILPTTEIKLGIEASDGKTKSFDDASDGTGMGEGVVAMVLKPLKAAQKDKDNVYAVIKGSAINQDGASIGITAPNVSAQTDVILQACKNANIDISTLGYIEAHGTGTKLGDPIEIEGISDAFKKSTKKKQFCAIGSLKTNIGHLYEASGITSLLKATLALKYKTIPPSINFNLPNCRINFEDSPVFFADREMKWNREEFPRRCGVSSFGYSGTNCHVILEEAPEPLEKENTNRNDLHVLTLSAKSPESLDSMIAAYEAFFREADDGLSIEDICYTANTRRGQYKYRKAFMFKDVEQLKKQLCKSVNGQESNMLIKQQNGVQQIIQEDIAKLSKLASQKIKDYSETSEDEDLLGEICELYMRGAKVDWSPLYINKNVKTVSIPTYQFKKNRVWFSVAKMRPHTIGSSGNSMYAKKVAPLVDTCILKTVNMEVYSTCFSADEYWEVQGHQIENMCMMTGSLYMEMIHSIMSNHYPDKLFEFTKVEFKSLALLDEEFKEVHTIIEKRADDWVFRIGLPCKGDEEATVFAEGEIRIINEYEQENIDISALKERCNYHVEETNQNILGRGHIKLGERWINYKDIYYRKGESLAQIELPIQFREDLKEMYIHPAIVDSALNVLSIINLQLYLPVAYNNFKLYHGIPEKIYSYAKIISEDESNETINMCVLLLDENGTVIGRIEECVLKKVANPKVMIKSCKTKKTTNDTGEVKLIGKTVGTYSENEIEIAKIWGDILGLEEIDIYRSFYEMGGDSILAIHLFQALNQKHPDIFNKVDAFLDVTISDMASYIH